MAPVVDTDSLLHSWVEASGTEHDLDGTEGVAVQLASTVGSPVVEIVSAPTPFRSGARTRRVNIRPRPIDLTLHIDGASATQVQQRLDALARWLDPSRGDGRLRVRRPDGTVRELWCRRSGGLDVDYREGVELWQDVLATLQATDDPYAYDVDPTEQTFTVGAALGFFTDPFFPIKLTSSTVLASATVNNTGDVEAWPVWTITGPGTNPVLRNVTTGQVTAFETTLVSGQQLILDTRPVARRGAGVLPVHDNLGSNLYPSLLTPTLWPLAVGVNQLQIEMNGADAASSVELEYTRRWWGF